MKIFIGFAASIFVIFGICGCGAPSSPESADAETGRAYESSETKEGTEKGQAFDYELIAKNKEAYIKVITQPSLITIVAYDGNPVKVSSEEEISRFCTILESIPFAEAKEEDLYGENGEIIAGHYLFGLDGEELAMTSEYLQMPKGPLAFQDTENGMNKLVKFFDEFKPRKQTADISVYSSPEVRTSLEEVTPDGACLLVQNSGPSLSGSSPYYIQRQEDGVWKRAEYLDGEEEGAWTEPLYEVGEEFRLELNWKGMYGSLEPGKYRVLYPCTLQGQEEPVCLAAEFEIG